MQHWIFESVLLLSFSSQFNISVLLCSFGGVTLPSLFMFLSVVLCIWRLLTTVSFGDGLWGLSFIFVFIDNFVLVNMTLWLGGVLQHLLEFQGCVLD